MRCFFFGSLMDHDVAELVLGRRIAPDLRQPGILAGYERLIVAEESYPALAPRPGGKVTGLIVEQISEADMTRMQFFESDEFMPTACDIERVGGEFVSAQVFVAREVLELTDQPWEFERWLHQDKSDYLLLVRDWMQQYGEREAHQLEAAWNDARRDQIARRQAGGNTHEQQSRGGKS